MAPKIDDSDWGDDLDRLNFPDWSGMSRDHPPIDGELMLQLSEMFLISAAKQGIPLEERKLPQGEPFTMHDDPSELED